MPVTDRFEAVGEDGQRYTVIETRETLTAKPLSGNHTSMFGAADYRLSDGRHVNWIDDETFKILDTNEVIRKV